MTGARLAILSSHPVQYYGPLFRELAGRLDLHVFFAHQPTAQQQGQPGFGEAFQWDIDLTSGYSHSFLPNRAARPGTDNFWGCDTPGVGAELRAGRFDALLVLGWHLKSMVQGALAARRLGVPVMVRGDSQLSTQRSPTKRIVKAALYPGLLRVYNAALYVGQRSLAYYRHYGYPPDQLFFSPHCVDSRRFSEESSDAVREARRVALGIPADAFAPLFAGKLVDFKRPMDVVSAVAAYRAAGGKAEMIVAGSGALGPAVQARATELGVPLHMLGFCNQSEMPAAYAAADCLVLPSNGRETWGLVANEALASGRPIIVSDACGCAPDLAADGSVGRTYRTGDIGALAACMAQLNTAPPGGGAIAAVSQRYSLAAAAEGVCEALVRLKRA